MVQFAVNIGPVRCQRWPSFPVNIGPVRCQHWPSFDNFDPIRCQHWSRVQFAINAGPKRRCALSPPSLYPCQPSNLPPGSLLSIEGAVQAEAKMGGDGSTSGESRQRNATCLISTPSAASRLLPPLCSVTSHLKELDRKCVEEGGWARVLYNANGGMEKLTFIRKRIQPAPNVPAPPQPCNLDAGLANGGMHEVKGGGRHGLRGGLTVPSPPHTLSAEKDDTATAVVATAGPAAPPDTTSPSPPEQPASPPQPTRLPLAVLQQPAPRLRNGKNLQRGNPHQ